MFAVRGNTVRPKVLIVGPLPPGFGGVQSMVEMQLHSCIAEEFELHVVDISKKVLRIIVENPTWRSTIYFLRDLRRLIRALILIRPVIVIVHAASSLSFLRDWAFMMLSRLSGAKVICHYHGTLHTRFPSCETSSGRRIGRMLMRAAHRIIVVGPTYQRRMGEAWHRPDIVWAPNVVDINLFSDRTLMQPVPWLTAGEQSVLFVGRLSAAKGIWDLLNAVPLVLQRYPKTQFLLVGLAENTACEADLHREVERRGLKGRIVFLGPLMGREKARAFLASHMLVVPSWTEAFPLVIPEAMAAGIPIIATEVGAIPDFVINGADGFLIPAHDPSALADRICCLLNDDGLRTSIGRRVRHRAAAEFSIDVGCRKVASVVRELVAN
jgi:glycosyltransferase involved in cell wall biosynthesis